MKYNFDRLVNRWNTDSMKYDGPQDEYGSSDYIPMWVADMDFATPQPVLDAVIKQVNYEILGYTLVNKEWAPSIIRWLQKRYQWHITPDELIFTPGIVRGLTFALRCFTQPQDKVLVMSPVYPPFFNVPTLNQREVVYHKLQLKNLRYEIDFEQFKQDIKGCKMFILCNPHNPGGRVWTTEELEQIAAICRENNTLVISDEIHADLTLPPYKHPTYASISQAAEQHSIVFMSPSKAFNMPGLGSSYAIIKNEALRQKYQHYVEALDVYSGHIFSYTPLIAAYNECEEWLHQVLTYVQENIQLVEDTLAQEMPKIKMIKPEASYLIFLDCRGLGMNNEQLETFFREQARLLLNPGQSFGQEGAGFMRLNVGCPRQILQKALKQLKEAYNQL